MTYKTSNLSLAGYFATMGFQPDELVKTGSMKSREGSSVYAFSYDDNFDELKELEKDYYAGKAKVDPKRYEYEKKSLKEMIDTRDQMN